MSKPTHVLRRLAPVATVLVLGAALVAPAIAGSGIGAVFNLGRTNSVNASTALTGTTSSTSLKITNKGTGSGLAITTASNVPPLRVSSSTKVANLNADRVDGIDSSAFVRDTGATQLQVGASSWRSINTSDPTVSRILTSGLEVTRSAIGTVQLVASPDLPVQVLGEGTSFRSLTLCYASSAGNELGAVEIVMTSASTGAGSGSTIVLDSTARTGSECRVYQPASPVALSSMTNMTIFVNVTVNQANTWFKLPRATMVIGPAG